MRTRPAIIIVIMLTACTPRLIPKPDPTQIILISPTPGEIQPTSTPKQGDAPNMTPTPSLPLTPNLESLIAKAKEDLAQRLSISATHIKVVDAKAVTWSNSSLGCPQPGMMYAEVLTAGYLIVLNTNNHDYEYHAGKGPDVFYCENPLPPVEGMPDNT
jgi:hypothetical protein